MPLTAKEMQALSQAAHGDQADTVILTRRMVAKILRALDSRPFQRIIDVGSGT